MAATLDQPTPSARHWKWEDLQRFDETERYEINDGRLISMPRSNTFRHQEVLGRILFLVESFLQQHPLGTAILGPMDVVFSDDNIAEPDLLFIANEHLAILKDHVFGAPDLMVEVLMPSSILRDRYHKLEQYARFGVKEYWIIDPANRSIEILTLHNGRYVLRASAVEKGDVSSLVLSGFTFDAAQIL